jgi:hypothetical protein
VFNGVADGGNGDVDTTRGKEGAGRSSSCPSRRRRAAPCRTSAWACRERTA